MDRAWEGLKDAGGEQRVGSRSGRRIAGASGMFSRGREATFVSKEAYQCAPKGPWPIPALGVPAHLLVRLH